MEDIEEIEEIDQSDPRKAAGRIMSGLVIVFLFFDGILKFIRPDSVTEVTVNELGYEEHHIYIFVTLVFISTILYALPRTAVLGAVLLTAYLGGAVASHLRVDSPLFSHVLFPVYVAILMWGGLWLRDERLSDLFPLRKDRPFS